MVLPGLEYILSQYRSEYGGTFLVAASHRRLSRAASQSGARALRVQNGQGRRDVVPYRTSSRDSQSASLCWQKASGAHIRRDRQQAVLRGCQPSSTMPPLYASPPRAPLSSLPPAPRIVYPIVFRHALYGDVHWGALTREKRARNTRISTLGFRRRN